MKSVLKIGVVGLRDKAANPTYMMAGKPEMFRYLRFAILRIVPAWLHLLKCTTLEAEQPLQFFRAVDHRVGRVVGRWLAGGFFTVFIATAFVFAVGAAEAAGQVFTRGMALAFLLARRRTVRLGFRRAMRRQRAVVLAVERLADGLGRGGHVQPACLDDRGAAGRDVFV